jgi:hypothetical protein
MKNLIFFLMAICSVLSLWATSIASTPNEFAGGLIALVISSTFLILFVTDQL